MQIFLRLFVLLVTVLQAKVVSVNYPFLVSDSQANLSQIVSDFEGNVLVVFDNGEVRRFLPNLTAYSNLTLGNGLI